MITILDEADPETDDGPQCVLGKAVVILSIPFPTRGHHTKGKFATIDSTQEIESIRQ